MYLFVRWFSNVPRPLTQTERMFTDIRTGEKLKFPSINRRSRSSSSLVDKVPDEIYLSIVIPAYNERQRLPTMLEQTLVYLEKRHKRDEKFSFEIIIVDDGSSDGTATIAHEWAAERMRKVWTKMRGM